MKKQIKKRHYILIALLGLMVIGSASYTTWNRLDPNYTCAMCHEVRPACITWEGSVHADITCTQCHGTALESFRSAKEKLSMVYTHFTSRKTFEDIHLTEEQSLRIAARCAECHQAEHAAWRSGAHSTTYKDIFMDVEHNRTERPYWDCFRCHGMFYDGDIDDLISMEGDVEKWHIKEEKQGNKPAMTCLACHQGHREQPRNIAYEDMDELFRTALSKKEKTPPTSLYMRADKRHIPATKLVPIDMYDGEELKQVITDPNTLLCMQCHSPNTARQLGSEDDKTPTGIYEGMSCITCHDPHSNLLKTDYKNVHTQK